MNINKINNILKSNPDLPKKLIIASAIVTAISVTLFATCFFGHFIPINGFTIGGSAALGALSITSMVGSAVMHYKSKKLKAQENEQIDLFQLKPEEQRKYMFEYFNKNSKNLNSIISQKLLKIKRTKHYIEQTDATFQRDQNAKKMLVKFQDKEEFYSDSTSSKDELNLNLLKENKYLLSTCTQTYINSIIELLNDSFQKITKTQATLCFKEQNENDTDGIIIQIDKNKYNIRYFCIKIYGYMEGTKKTVFENPIELECSFDLIKDANGEWICENMKILPPKIIKKEQFSIYYDIIKSSLNELFSYPIEELKKRINSKIKFKEKLNLSDIADLILAKKLKESLIELKSTLLYLKEQQKKISFISFEFKETLSKIEKLILEIDSFMNASEIDIEKLISDTREANTWFLSEQSFLFKENPITKINNEIKFLRNIEFEKNEDIIDEAIFI